MNVRSLYPFALGLTLAVAASAQDPTSPPPSPAPQAQASSGGQGQRGAGRGWGGGMGMGRGLMGTVTEVAADHYTIKTETGETYTVHFSANTRILKQQARARGEGGERGGGGEGGPGGGGNPPTPLKSTDIKVGDAIAAMGELDATAKSVGATMVMQIDPERAKQMREMQANYGKTWLMGKVTAIDGVKVTLTGVVDNTAHAFVADENTTFRKRRDPITLADIQVGDTVRVEGALKDGAFLATQVSAMGQPPAGTPSVPRNAPPPSAPQ
jgi:preprotein translocase subunit YajC